MDAKRPAGDEQRLGRRRLGEQRDGRRVAKRELNAGLQRPVDADIVVRDIVSDVAQVLLHALEEASEVGVVEWRCGEPSRAAIEAAKGAIGRENMKMSVEPEVTAEALHHGDEARMQVGDRWSLVVALHSMTDGLQKATGEGLAYAAQEPSAAHAA